MEDKDISKIVSGLKESINIMVTESVYEQTKYKDEEVSGLHREINNKLTEQGRSIDKLTKLIEDHDTVIQELRQIYKTSGYIKKFILWFLVFVPSVAGFVAGIKYIHDTIRN